MQSEGSNNNNGVDYEISAGEPVVSVAEGVIVLISDIVGGNGKIVLIKHANELITIYGRLKNVAVSKGQRVLQGEKIGEVIEAKANKQTTMHFEVRRGMKSIDPTTMIR